MLAPLAIAVTLGLSQHPAPIAAPFKLSVNGNALAMSTEFAAALDRRLRPSGCRDPVADRARFRGRDRRCTGASR